MPSYKDYIDVERLPTPYDEADEFGENPDLSFDRQSRHRLDFLRARMGFFGQLIGSTEASETIAFVTIILCLLFMALVFFVAYEPDTGRVSEMVLSLLSLLLSVVTGCIGYIFGKSKKS
ncbi:MAG: hypothetical protein PSN37_00720 [Alphaproteobacteria bacterium]|nr:hypothetical protein [Alphaproteobacteria bacterium]